MKREKVINYDKEYFMPVYSGRYPLVANRGEGCKVFDKNGDIYLDFLSGIGVNILGHAHPVLVKALQEQVAKLIHCSNFYYIEEQSLLEKLLADNSCFDKMFFANSGAEANEGAIKLVRKYHKARGKDRYEIITTVRSFHGRTLATLAATGQEKYKKPFAPLPVGFKIVEFNNLESVEQALSDKTAAIMVEPIQGEGGIYPADISYLKGLRELCDREGILLIFDEIQTGMGRTGYLFSYQDYGVEPDIITLAKGLGAGVPIGVFMAKEEVANSFNPGDHGTTFGGNPLACRAGCETLQILLENGFLQDVQKMGNYFKNKLQEIVEEDSAAIGVRGKGLMLALELTDQCSAAEITLELFKKGFLINAVKEHTLRFLPPLIISEEEIDKLIFGLKEVLETYVGDML